MEKRWYAIYTKPRCEKKVDKLLTEKGMESYCPLQKIQRQWSDRKKIVEEPLFKSYVFVRIPEDEQTAVRMVNGVVNFVYWLGQPAIIKDKDIEIIQRFLDTYELVEVTPVTIVASQKVIITSGIMMNHEATVKRVRNNIVEVIIDSLGVALTASINKSKIKVIGK